MILMEDAAEEEEEEEEDMHLILGCFYNTQYMHVYDVLTVANGDGSCNTDTQIPV
jgi:hypothetical protein